MNDKRNCQAEEEAAKKKNKEEEEEDAKKKKEEDGVMYSRPCKQCYYWEVTAWGAWAHTGEKKCCAGVKQCAPGVRTKQARFHVLVCNGP